MNQSIILNAYAARSCPRKTHNQFDATMGDEPKLEVPAYWDGLFTQGNEFESRVFQVFQESLGDECLNLDSKLPEKSFSMSEHIKLTVAAMQAGSKVILGGYLPDDLVGGRRGKPDILIRGVDQVDGRPSYFAADVKFHRVIEKHEVKSPQSTLLSWPDKPSVEDACVEVGWNLDKSHFNDWLQLAHYQRMLRAMGFAAPENLAALIGSGTVNEREMALVWICLDGVAVRSYSETEDVVERNILDEYDYQFFRRKEIARIALRQAMDDAPAPMVEPIYQLECEACSWRGACPTRLAANEATWTMKIGRDGTRREWELLRAHGVSTIEDVARLDPAGVIVNEIAALVHTPRRAKERLASYQRIADMVLRGVHIERITEGNIDVPIFDVEVDFDIEWLPDEPPYLYGFLLKTPEVPATYHHVSSFEHQTNARGQDLARTAVQWLIDQRDIAEEQGYSFGVFHYTHPEKTEVRKALGDEHQEFERLVGENFVDLMPIVKQNFYGVQGLGLKKIAVYGAGFTWRDETPGGLNSQIWAEEAIAGSEESCTRVLAYNEDDVRATAVLREWFWKLNSTAGGSST